MELRSVISTRNYEVAVAAADKHSKTTPCIAIQEQRIPEFLI